MIISRKTKLFNLQDGYGGLKSRLIKNTKRNFSSYKSFGPWKVTVEEMAELDLNDPKYFTDEELERVNRIIQHISKHPYDLGWCGIHPLWDWDDKYNLCTVWSADITKKDRLIYVVFKDTNTISVINVREHYVLDEPYSESKLKKKS